MVWMEYEQKENVGNCGRAGKVRRESERKRRGECKVKESFLSIRFNYGEGFGVHSKTV